MANYRSYLTTVAVTLFSAALSCAQPTPGPGLFQKQKICLDTFRNRQIYKSTYIAAPFIVSGLALYNNSGKRFQDLRNEFAPNFSKGFDDYIQYSPALILYGLKIGGVKGKSSWKRLLTTQAFSAVSMFTLVNGIKHTTEETRPDGKGGGSYPSGHTATAFMCANMIHHEYGLTRSPLYSIGAYSIATATAVSRVLNNEHYLHDVLLGAGIGILSTELGYMFSSLIFRERGVLMSDKDYGNPDMEDPAPYLGLTIGFNKVLNYIPVTSSVKIKSSWGSTSGAEGTYYLGGQWGLTANASLFTARTYIMRGRFDITGPPLSWYNIGAGPCYSQPVTDYFRIGGKLTAGYSELMKRSLNGYTIPSAKGLNLTAGLFADRYITQGMFIKLFANLEKTFFDKSSFNLLNVVTGASVNIDLGILNRN